MNRFWLLAAMWFAPVSAADAEPPSEVLAIEHQRIQVVEKITPATIAIFDQQGQGGGSGVLISRDGLALTNFHVVAPCGPFMACGLPDGSFVDAVLIGLDPTGDIALIRLLDKRVYPTAEIGDSAEAAIGDEVYVAGNPFLLADDFRPTITHGVLSGVRRYQYPAGGVLEYADCLQTDAAINPGNSGGPIYDADGRLIGINGRGSFEKRGRVNVGVGYAVSINQVMRFVDQLQTGRVVDHGALGATVLTTNDRRVLIDAVDQASDAYRQGLRYGDQVLAIDGRRVTSANALMNAIATRPDSWRTKIEFRNADGLQQAWVRLAPSHRNGELERVVERQLSPLEPSKPGQPPTIAQTHAEQYGHRPGFANFAVNRRQTQKLLDACPQRSPGNLAGVWRVTAQDAAGEQVTITLSDERSELFTPQGRFWIEASRPFQEQAVPSGSGGLLVALHAWRQFVIAQDAGLKRYQRFGTTPWDNTGELAERVDAMLGIVRIEHYLDLAESRLVGIEAWLQDDADPCRVVFADFGDGPAQLGDDAPASLVATRNDREFAVWSLVDLQINAGTEKTSGMKTGERDAL